MSANLPPRQSLTRVQSRHHYGSTKEFNSGDSIDRNNDLNRADHIPLRGLSQSAAALGSDADHQIPGVLIGIFGSSSVYAWL